MQNKIRNKYANKSLKNGYKTFNDYKGNQGYIEIIKDDKGKNNIFNILKYLLIVLIMFILSFHLITKYLI